ncbi:GRIP1-associated protein 1 [Cinclus cinclus]|uniref:GRIP1-associated protein 1 n=1 Tax=Cinclus cinclus TaxID=127875 RepID=UPI002E1586CE
MSSFGFGGSRFGALRVPGLFRVRGSQFGVPRSVPAIPGRFPLSRVGSRYPGSVPGTPGRFPGRFPVPRVGSRYPGSVPGTPGRFPVPRVGSRVGSRYPGSVPGTPGRFPGSVPGTPGRFPGRFPVPRVGSRYPGSVPGSVPGTPGRFPGRFPAQRSLRDASEARAQELRDSESQRERLQRELQVCSGERDELRQRLHEAEAAQGPPKTFLGPPKPLPIFGGPPQERLREEQEKEQEQLQAALGEEQRLRERHEAEARALRQELKDLQAGQRILEKKGSAALKDLRRQLQLERRRGERLQERLQELLLPARNRSGLEELGLDGGSPGRGPGGDSSSVSSLGRDGSAPGSTKSGSGSPGGGSAGGVPGGGGLSPAEVAELFQRLAQSQQERWLLEEKVRHLEVSSASMAEDLCRKSAIIQSFVRDSRTEAVGPSGPPRRGAGAGPGEEGLREMNKKLQNLLEEQLTKNLHLAQDLESLSQELAHLRKEQAPPPGPP